MVIAEKLSKQQKEVSVAEFFEKNRHLLGFDSRLKATLTIIKEAVDNSIDACEEMNQELPPKLKNKNLPVITVDLKKVEEVYEIIESGITSGEIVCRGGEFEVSYQGRRGTFKSKYAGHNFKIGGYEIKLKIDEQGKMSLYVNGEKKETKQSYPKFRIKVIDNGPGIVKDQIPKIFGTLLYGSKFTRLRQSRGQQGIGITSALLYGQLTTGRPMIVTSRIRKDKPSYRMYFLMDTATNKADVLNTEIVKEFPYESGTMVELEFEGEYRARGDKSVEDYLRRTAIVNPHVTIIFDDVDGKKVVFKSTVDKYPKPSKEIKPHPYGLELGMLIKLLKNSKRKTMLELLTKDLSRMSLNTAQIVLSKSEIKETTKPVDLDRDQSERLLKAMQRTKLLRPPTDVLSPIGSKELESSLKKETGAEFVVTVSRQPTTYRGMPFMVEVGLAYGGNINSTCIYRYANKIPLSYEQSSCAVTRAVSQVDWRRYKITSAQNGLPQENVVIIGHLASVWVPYTSESKAAIASYPEIIKEFKLAYQEAARKLGVYLSARYKEKIKRERVSKFVTYGCVVSESLSSITGVERKEIDKAITDLIESKIGKITAKDRGENQEEVESK